MLTSLFNAIYGLAVRLHVRRYGPPPRDAWTLDEVLGHFGYTRDELVCTVACETVGGSGDCTCVGS